MSLLFKAGPADVEARAVFPAFGCPSGGLWYNSELEQPASTPHLVRCLRCAALNGRSASLCWSCEAELPAALPVAKPLGAGSHTEPTLAPQQSPLGFVGALGGADAPTVPGVVHAPDHAEAAFSAPAPADALDERLAAFSQHRRRAPRRLLGTAAIVVFAAASGTGAYLVQRPPPFIALETNPAPRDVTAIVEPSAGAGRVTARLADDPSRAELPDAVQAEAAAPARIIEPLERAAQAVSPPRAAPPSPATGLTATRGGTARGTRNARNAAVPLPAPIRGGSDTRRPTPAQPGSCTATVAALGLCQAPNAQSKE